jgi:nucleotide-binding universal stress UspA family protein
MCFGVPCNHRAGREVEQAPTGWRTCRGRRPTRSRLTVSGHPRSVACWRIANTARWWRGRSPASQPAAGTSMAMAAKLTALAPDLRQDRDRSESARYVRQVSFTVFLSLLMATFVCIGFVLAVVMGRLGHSPFAWGLLGLVLGPIALLLALVAARDKRAPSQLVASGVAGSGPVDVLVGIDGSPESAAAATAALDLLGGRVGRLTLMAVTDIDDSVAGSGEQARLCRVLDGQAHSVRAWLREHHPSVDTEPTVIPELVLRSGQPAATLDRMAAEDGYGLLVVGARGAGLSRVLLGSVATRLAARANVPVLVIGDRVRDAQGEGRLHRVNRAEPHH